MTKFWKLALAIAVGSTLATLASGFLAARLVPAILDSLKRKGVI